MAASKRSEFSVDVEGKRSTKETGKEKRVPNLDNDFIITKRVEKGLKRWKFLQTEIPRKQRKVEKGDRSKRLEPYKKERDGLVEQMQKDIPELQSIFYDKYSNAFDRKDKRRTTTGDMRKENRETLRVPNLDNDFIITKRVEKGLKRWKFLQTEIPRKQRKVEKGDRSKRLEPYKKERDGLVEQMQNDIPELQSIFHDEYSNAFDRKDKRLTTTGDMRNENRETLSLRSAKSKTDQLKSQLENERKSKEQNLSSLNRRLEKSENEKFSLKLSHKVEIRVHKEEIRKLQERLTIAKSYEERAKDLEIKCYELETELGNLEDQKRRTEEELKSLRSAESEINQLKSQLKNERKSKEEIVSRLNRSLDECENEKAALKLNHKEEIGVHKEEIRKFQERLTIDKAYEERAKDLEIKCYELETELARLKRKLDESEKEKVTLKLNHKEEIEEYKEEIRKLQERLSNSGKIAALA